MESAQGPSCGFRLLNLFGCRVPWPRPVVYSGGCTRPEEKKERAKGNANIIYGVDEADQKEGMEIGRQGSRRKGKEGGMSFRED